METITKDGILNSNELYLLQNFEANLVALNLKIAEQENKKNEVTCLFDTLSKTDSVSKINSKKDYAEKINKISKKFVNNIKKDISLADIEVDTFVKEINYSDNSKSEEISSEISEEISEENIQNSNTLIISEKDNKVFLPYTVSEIQSYMEKYPKEYKSLEYVINKEFILPLDYYTKHPSLARFREAYSLIRDREAKSVFDALKYALNVMFKYDLNPAIISACKTEEALNFYIECLENKDLSKFNLFKIEFKLNPLKAAKFENEF